MCRSLIRRLEGDGPWTLGVLANNVWSVAGAEDRSSVNRGLLQHFIVRQMGNGWYLNSAPINTANWKADSGRKWLVPLGGGGDKLVFASFWPWKELVMLNGKYAMDYGARQRFQNGYFMLNGLFITDVLSGR